MNNIIVVGAGVAGLAAALRLAEAGCQVTVLEAADHVGGRIRTVHVGGAAVELGAEFVHGKPPELLALLDELGLERYAIGGTDISFAPDGTLHPHTGDEEDEGDPGDPFALLNRVVEWTAAHPAEDLAFADFVRQHAPDAADIGSATGYVEGFNAADAAEISVQSLAVQQRAEDSIEGGTNLHVRGGYGQLPQRLAERLQAAGGTVLLQREVTEVHWHAQNERGREAGVTCTCRSGEMFHAKAAVLTLPLGVLQGGGIRFESAPGDLLQQAARMRMGQVCRINLVFRRRWWAEINHTAHEALQTLGFLLPEERPPGRHFNVFWTGFPNTDPVLTAWVGGPAAAAFDALDDHAIAHIACCDLARIFGLPHEVVLDELVSHHLHNWHREPLSRGAYSWVPVGAVDASAKMAEPVENTLFFAGEHTDTTGHWGTVHGALRSGLRAAGQVLANPVQTFTASNAAAAHHGCPLDARRT